MYCKLQAGESRLVAFLKFAPLLLSETYVILVEEDKGGFLFPNFQFLTVTTSCICVEASFQI